MCYDVTDFLLDDILLVNELAHLEEFILQDGALTLISALRSACKSTTSSLKYGKGQRGEREEETGSSASAHRQRGPLLCANTI